MPLSEEFEYTLDYDIILREFLPEIEVILKRRDRLGATVDYRKADQKAKISKYSEAAGYICEVNNASAIYLTKIYDLLIENIFSEKNEFTNWNVIYFLTRTLTSELVNGGYSIEHIN